MAEKSPQHKAQKSPKKKAEKEQKSPKVGSYTKLLQSIGGRGPNVETGPSLRMKSNYSEDSRTANQADPLKSRKKAEAHQLLLEQSVTGDAERGRSQQGGGGARGGAKLSHKEQVKLRSEAFKQNRQNQQRPRSESPSTVDRQDLGVAVKGGMFYRSSEYTAQVEAADNTVDNVSNAIMLRPSNPKLI